ncbi:DUF4040 domain-containing protein [Rubrobacter taiwanensis]|jgi:energy-converting hydrogenase B subunit D|uniref:DUF4040 domain-containing protein n=1 Tax=Rubrobacter taiwanensis TaxID=185139 RepID=A0A4R1BLU9_9ACTN|nr:DUF4040 domain-containing protein [Rubrobacter taiwanensis]TCJ18421.1 DUF4040 domain-containing protein [Rubrobacter taiwanensis]
MSAEWFGWIFDILLALALPVLAWRVLITRNLYQAVILFVAFGLLMALAWVRLEAPDVALAEAAIGAGITGVLFLDALGYLRDRRRGGEADERG